jgi:hypothetical protein
MPRHRCRGAYGHQNCFQGRDHAFAKAEPLASPRELSSKRVEAFRKVNIESSTELARPAQGVLMPLV